MRDPPYRALSLDLWFTTVSFHLGTLKRWREAREQVLRSVLELPQGFPDPEELRRVQREVRRAHHQDQLWGETMDPGRFVAALAEGLGGGLRVPMEEAGARYSDAGLQESPPEVNPEAEELVRALRERGVPVIAVTNTGRREESWRRFFESRGGPLFQTIVTSCEVGEGKPSPEIFRVAGERLGVSPGDMLHVGDRWDIDVAGARAVGAGPVLYSGLWERYAVEGDDDPELNRRLDDGGSDVLRVRSLLEVLERARFAAGPVGPSAPGP